jgi:signal transduction histidine kinase
MDRRDEADAGEATAAPTGSGELPARGDAAGATSVGAGDSNGDGGPGGSSGAPARERRRLFGDVVARATRRRIARRLLAAADAERERIERDIHDGVQQRLTALRIRLALAAERFDARGDAEASDSLTGFGSDVDQIIQELRDITHGIYPRLLTSTGLSAALAAATGHHTAHPVTVRTNGVRRCRPEVEAAIYFSCLAAIDNAAKHAGSAKVSVELLHTESALRFTVSDSGVGFDLSRPPNGYGLAHMRARISAVGGELTVDSTPAHGTRIRGTVPDPWLDAPPTGRRS